MGKIISLLVAMLFYFSMTGVAFAERKTTAQEPAAKIEGKKTKPRKAKKAAAPKAEKRVKKGKKAAKKKF